MLSLLNCTYTVLVDMFILVRTLNITPCSIVVGLLSLFLNWKPRHSKQPFKLFVSLRHRNDTCTMAFSNALCWCGWFPTVLDYMLRAAADAFTSQTMFRSTDRLGDALNVLCQHAGLWHLTRMLCFITRPVCRPVYICFVHLYHTSFLSNTFK